MGKAQQISNCNSRNIQNLSRYKGLLHITDVVDLNCCGKGFKTLLHLVTCGQGLPCLPEGLNASYM